MKSADWKDIAELIGIGAIVASLIFVGMQMKQSQEIAVADQYQDRADAALEWYLARMSNDQPLALTSMWVSDLASADNSPIQLRIALESESPDMLAVRYLSYRANLTMFDNYHFQHERGFLTDEAWQAYRVRLKGVLSDKVTAEMYRQQADHWRRSFREFCLQLLTELEAEEIP
jgi:hypothetical protein